MRNPSRHATRTYRPGPLGSSDRDEKLAGVVGVCPVTRKFQYAARSAARTAIKKMVKQGVDRSARGSSGPLVAYECTHCPHWHIGHNQLAVR